LGYTEHIREAYQHLTLSNPPRKHLFPLSTRIFLALSKIGSRRKGEGGDSFIEAAITGQTGDHQERGICCADGPHRRAVKRGRTSRTCVIFRWERYFVKDSSFFIC